jgi:hypothetical protein
MGEMGYAPVPGHEGRDGGWRRVYVRDATDDPVAAVGDAASRYASLGVELDAPRRRVHERALALATALAPYEVALDLDAGPDSGSPDGVVRVALRVFLEGLTAGVVRQACDNVAAAAQEARRALA